MNIRTDTRAIDKIYKRRDRYDIPEWQRQEVWSRSKKQNLIDSILRGWTLPKFYFLKVADQPEAFEVVDGQQRLAAIFEFFDNDLPLADSTATRVGAKYYRDLPDAVTDAFDDYEIQFDAIEKATDEEIREFFQRLQEGLPLTSSEKLNSVSSKLRDFVTRLTKLPLFKKVGASNRRHGHFDILAKVAAIEVDGLDVGLRYDDLRAVFESQSSFSAQSHVGKRLIAAVHYLDKALGKRSSDIRNRTIWQSLLTLTCRLLNHRGMAGQASRVGKFLAHFLEELTKQVVLGKGATDADYIEFQRTVNANVKTGAQIRHQILLRKLFAFDPGIAEVLDGSIVSEGGVRATIAQDVAGIVRGIAHLNEQYAAKFGENLFKPTNRTAQAQAHIGTPIQDFNGYKTFIDDLYFIFEEGVGERLGANTPVVFKDVNTLRTDLDHDVEHGDAKKVRRKKRRIGTTFRKYAGAPSPFGLSPERFVVVQSNLLQTLRSEIDNMVV